MKKFIASFLTVFPIVALVVFPVLSQTQPEEESAGILYRITRKDIAKPSFIFGTFHLICPSDMLPIEKLSVYADQTDQFVMEIDMDDPSEMQSMAKGVSIPNGKTLNDFLTAQQLSKVDEMFESALGYSVENVKRVKPSLLAVMVTASPKILGCSPPSSYDRVLMQSAAAKKKPLIGLETVNFQFQMLDLKPTEKQAIDLYEMALNPQKSSDGLKKLLLAYKSQDSELIYRTTGELTTEDREFQTRFLDDRNKSWIPKLEKAVKEKPSFIAVGAAHLGGKNGVISLLRGIGYEVKAIRL